MANTDTIVLPEPTSPCSSRFIGLVVANSAVTTPSTSRCPAVSSNGSRPISACGQPVVAMRRGRPGFAEFTMPALGQRPLHADRFVEPQPLTGGLPLRFPLGDVNVAQRGILGDQTTLFHNSFR